MAEWLAGPRPVYEALRGGNRRVHEVWVEEGPASPALEQICALARARGITVRLVSGDALAGLGLLQPRRVAARCGPFRYRDEGRLPVPAAGTPALLVVLDHLQDPQNLGAIARTAEAVGALGLCIPRRRAAAVTPAVVRASAGATEHLPVYRVGNVARTVERLKAGGYWVVGLDPAGAERWDRVDYRRAVALVVGAEGVGLRRLVRERCDHRVALPMQGRVGSLNVSAAFAAVAYEALRQRLGGR